MTDLIIDNRYTSYTACELMSAYTNIIGMIGVHNPNDPFVQELNERTLDIEQVAYDRNDFDLIAFIHNTGDGVVR